MNRKYTSLEQSLGHSFQDRTLLAEALIHPSYRYEHEGTVCDNQRLEFLGDAVLGLVAGEYLFERFEDVQEGTLTRLRSAVISTTTLSVIAARIGLGDLLQLGHGERKSGGAERASNLADALEAIIGAVYLDGGMPAVKRLFERFFPEELQRVLEAPETDNPKGTLQEFAQQHLQVLPDYVLTAESGPPHCRVYDYELHLGARVIGHGSAGSKREAQALAAREALDRLSREGMLKGGEAHAPQTANAQHERPRE